MHLCILPSFPFFLCVRTLVTNGDLSSTVFQSSEVVRAVHITRQMIGSRRDKKLREARLDILRMQVAPPHLRSGPNRSQQNLRIARTTAAAPGRNGSAGVNARARRVPRRLQRSLAYTAATGQKRTTGVSRYVEVLNQIAVPLSGSVGFNFETPRRFRFRQRRPDAFTERK